MVKNKKYQVKYSYIDYEQPERQKRLYDVFDIIFDEIENDDLEGIDNKKQYEQKTINYRTQ
jgi:hypothetical protein